VSVRGVANRLRDALGKSGLSPELTRKYRVCDVRHCFADITRARELLGYEPTTDLDVGMRELGHWLASERAVDRTEVAQRELERRGLSV
jgi:dTDP-L-rhamnose 4-epimerase